MVQLYFTDRKAAAAFTSILIITIFTFVFSSLKCDLPLPLFISLHWLPVAARIKFKTLMLAYRTATGSAPAYFHSLIQSTSPPEVCPAGERRLVVLSQRGTKSLSRTFSFTVPGWWNEIPPPSGMLNPWQFSSDTWTPPSTVITWLCLKKKKPSLSFLNCALFPLPSHCLSRMCSEQCLDICITSTSCVCVPLYNVLLIVFLNCKSLWIKASAKLINVKQEVSNSFQVDGRIG